VYLGDSLANDTFTVANGCEDTLDYEVTEGADWLSVSPTRGSVTGETDTIEVRYDGVGSLSCGVYDATITVTGNAANSPQEISVQVTIYTAPGDFDCDCDVDLEDFGHFQACLSGPGIAQLDPECLDAHLDSDNDVDAADFSIFQRCISGPNVCADPNCRD